VIGEEVIGDGLGRWIDRRGRAWSLGDRRLFHRGLHRASVRKGNRSEGGIDRGL